MLLSRVLRSISYSAKTDVSMAASTFEQRRVGRRRRLTSNSDDASLGREDDGGIDLE